jgi:hypothetical protein
MHMPRKLRTSISQSQCGIFPANPASLIDSDWLDTAYNAFCSNSLQSNQVDDVGSCVELVSRSPALLIRRPPDGRSMSIEPTNSQLAALCKMPCRLDLHKVPNSPIHWPLGYDMGAQTVMLTFGLWS